MHRFADIPLAYRFADVREITEGMSGDRKYRIAVTNGEHWLLRIADVAEYDTKRKDAMYLHRLWQAGLPVPKVIASGPCEGGKSVYTLLEWMEGTEAEQTVPQLPQNEQYAFGIKSGEILRAIHENTAMPHMGSWLQRYCDVMQPRFDAYREKGEPFAGSDTVLRFLEDNMPLLEGRPQCRLHGDYHLGNMIISEAGKLFIIDWQTVDFGGAADGWYDFTRLALQYPAVAAGQIDGYFGGDIPQAFWRLLAVYLSASCLTSIVWAKHRMPELLPEVLQNNADNAAFLAQTKDYIPAWYKAFHQSCNPLL